MTNPMHEWEKKPHIQGVKNQMLALKYALETFDYLPSEMIETFLWETMLELWARHKIRDAHPTAPSAYDCFLAWFPEFDIENV